MLRDSSVTTAEFVQAHPELEGRPPCQARFSWLPASDSPEAKLVASQYCNGMPPDNLLQTLIDAIQSGTIDLTPTETSGFYDWQLHAFQGWPRERLERQLRRTRA